MQIYSTYKAMRQGLDGLISGVSHFKRGWVSVLHILPFEALQYSLNPRLLVKYASSLGFNRLVRFTTSPTLHVIFCAKLLTPSKKPPKKQKTKTASLSSTRKTPLIDLVYQPASRRRFENMFRTSQTLWMY